MMICDIFQINRTQYAGVIRENEKFSSLKKSMLPCWMTSQPYTVTLPALQAIATPRVYELSVPLARRCTPKKVLTARVMKSFCVY